MADILLLEPDHVLAEIYCQTMARAGHKVTIATSAQGAITAADAIRPDIVILELQLVEHSGIEFLYEFRSYQDWQHIPVLIHTQVPPGEFTANRQLLKKQLGIQAYLYKPHTSLRELVSQIDEQLSVEA